jgi:hypothetical protein
LAAPQFVSPKKDGDGHTRRNDVTKATNLRDRPHARVYAHWRRFPAWRALSLASRALLVEILLEYRPGLNGCLEWPCRKAAHAIGVSKDTAARALTQLELLGWLTVERIGGFRRRNAATHYALTMFPNDQTGAPPLFAFEVIDPNNPLLGRLRVAPQGHGGRISGTPPSRPRDTKVYVGGFLPVTDRLKKTRIFKAIEAEVAKRAKPERNGAR